MSSELGPGIGEAGLGKSVPHGHKLPTPWSDQLDSTPCSALSRPGRVNRAGVPQPKVPQRVEGVPSLHCTSNCHYLPVALMASPIPDTDSFCVVLREGRGEAEAGQLPRKAVSQCFNGESRGWGGQVGETLVAWQTQGTGFSLLWVPDFSGGQLSSRQSDRQGRGKTPGGSLSPHLPS